MGKKVSPHALRIGITRTWDSKWYSNRNYKVNFLQDLEIRKFIEDKLKKAGVSQIEIERHTGGNIKVIVHVAKPGIVIGRSGENIGLITDELRSTFKSDGFELSVQEVRKPEASAKLVAENIAEQVERRFPYRRVCKMAVDKAKEAGVKGIKVLIGGRLNGVDIARSETYSWGTVPLHTLRANIDYSTGRAETMYGSIGIKVWIYKGLVFKNQKLNEEQ